MPNVIIVENRGLDGCDGSGVAVDVDTNVMPCWVLWVGPRVEFNGDAFGNAFISQFVALGNGLVCLDNEGKSVATLLFGGWVAGTHRGVNGKGEMRTKGKISSKL